MRQADDKSDVNCSSATYLPDSHYSTYIEWNLVSGSFPCHMPKHIPICSYTASRLDFRAFSWMPSVMQFKLAHCQLGVFNPAKQRNEKRNVTGQLAIQGQGIHCWLRTVTSLWQWSTIGNQATKLSLVSTKPYSKELLAYRKNSARGQCPDVLNFWPYSTHAQRFMWGSEVKKSWNHQYIPTDGWPDNCMENEWAFKVVCKLKSVWKEMGPGRQKNLCYM